MSAIKCPSCGNSVNVPEKKSVVPWMLGCLILLIAIPVGFVVFGLIAGSAIPSYLNARGLREKNECVYNMGKIEAAKAEWAKANGATNGQAVDVILINDSMTGTGAPACPARGTYTYHEMGTEPECSVHGSPSEPRVAGSETGTAEK